jgi:hypothetical protein
VSAPREHPWDGPALVAGIVTAVIWLSAVAFGGGSARFLIPDPPTPDRTVPHATDSPAPSWPPPTSAPGELVLVPWRLLEARYSTIPIEPGGGLAEPVARFAVVEGAIDPGKGGFYVVTLTARSRDVSLNPCPDFTVAGERYGLDCAGVPFRDEEGAPFLPEDRPVGFVIGVRGHGKAWELAAPDGVRLPIP